ncbi:MAG: hypothetical protein ABIE14_04620 [Patescibacteria group bacterium]
MVDLPTREYSEISLKLTEKNKPENTEMPEKEPIENIDPEILAEVAPAEKVEVEI